MLRTGERPFPAPAATLTKYWYPVQDNGYPY
jgi:hypothetical protein